MSWKDTGGSVFGVLGMEVGYMALLNIFSGMREVLLQSGVSKVYSTR